MDVGVNFNKKELNQIINTLRTDRISIFGKCGAIFKNDNVNEARLITKESELISKNSASLTDVILSQAEIGDGRRRPKFKVAVKMWFGWNNVSEDDLQKGIDKACIKMSRSGVCSDTEKGMILEKLILPKSKISNGKKVPVGELFTRSIDALKDASNTLSLTYEARLYTYITENIILRNISPGFIPILSASTCSVSEMIDVFKKNAFKGSDQIVNKLTFIESMFGDKISLNFIITGSGDKMEKFITILETYNLSTAEAANIVFQALYAFYVMDAYGIFHGDLHAENLFVQILDTPVNLAFAIGDRVVTFSTRYIFKVYDFDRSYLADLGENVKNNDFIKSGMDNYMRKNVDFAHFICLCVRHEVEGKKAKKPFTSVLEVLQLAHIATLEYAEKPADSKDMGQCTKHSVTLSNASTKNLIRWLQVNNSAVRDFGSKNQYFRISPEELKTIIKRDEYTNLLSVFQPEYIDNAVERLLLRYDSTDPNIKLFVCRQWLCSPSNDIRVSITSYFVDPIRFSLLKSTVSQSSAIPKLETLNYVFRQPNKRESVPEYTLNEIYHKQMVADRIIEDAEVRPVKRRGRRL